MHMEAEFVERLKNRGLGEVEVASSLRRVERLRAALAGGGFSLERPDLATVETWISDRLAAGESALDILLPLARYFATTHEPAIAIRLLAYLSPVGVLPAMSERLASLEGQATRDRVMARVVIPPEGSPPEAYPEATARFVRRLANELGEGAAGKVLAWNVHGIPPEAFAGERARFLELGSIDVWLADYHRRQVEILNRHAEDGTLWFEQKITRAVVDFVRDRQEIMSGVRNGDRIFMTKIPYDPDRYLATSDPLERRRLACHCPLAVSSITEKGAAVPPLWCACSAGYTKFRFDIVFGEETEAAVVNSVLAGDEVCRFAIKIPASLAKGPL
ncbi:MAG TPA: hypothetical protein VN445_12805 [Rectinemataceae bacterium]|nr:hypothetical protein [Rectinemataceae bacterium]